MSNQYDEKWFWSIIDLVDGDREALKKILNGFTREEIEQFHEHFVEFSLELQGEPYTEYMEESEDGIEDISWWVVSRGRKYYDEVLENPDKVPYSVDDKDESSLYGVTNEVYYSRFQETIER